MKRFFLYMVAAVCLISCNDKTNIWMNSITDIDSRVTVLEQLCAQINTNIVSLQTIVNALQNNDYITNVTEVKEGDKIIGYTITFAKNPAITIYNGKDGKDGVNGKDGQDGKDGVDGITPVIGAAIDTDSIYYWTLNGTWLLDAQGNKIRVTGEDGQDGKDGEDGADGQDGVSPKLKIESDYWYISYDNGSTWTQLGKAKGEDGQDGEDGEDGDSMFRSVTYDANYVYLVLADNTLITIPIKKPARTDSIENGHRFVDMGLSVEWATMNIGATKPEDFGSYFAWGETIPKSQYLWTTYKYGRENTLTKYCNIMTYGYNGYIDNKHVLEICDDAASANWNGTWRTPTKEEWEELFYNCQYERITLNQVIGYKVTGKNGNSIFLPEAAGYNKNGFLQTYGYYQSATLYATNPNYNYGVDLLSDTVFCCHYNERSAGTSVRAVCLK